MENMKNSENPAPNPATGLGSSDHGLVALNNVHSIAAKLWMEKIPVVQQPHNQRQKGRGGRGAQQRRITPVQLPFRDARANFNGTQQNFGQQRQFQNSQFEQLLEQTHAHGGHTSRNAGQVQVHQGYNKSYGGRNNQGSQENFGYDSNKKRAQIKTLPIKPPDIQNIDLFPPIGSTPVNPTVSPTTALEVKAKGSQVNPFASTGEESKFDPNYERKKMFAGVRQVQTEITTTISPEVPQSQAKAQNVKPLQRSSPISESNLDGTVSKPPLLAEKEKGRSAELFAQLSSAKIKELKELSSNFSESLDANLCRSILAEITFLCQLLVANNDEAVTSVNCGQAKILASLPARVWFVSRIFEYQLQLISNISPDIVQMLIDFYPHRIPKQLRKKFEMIIQQKTANEAEAQLHFQSSPNKYPGSVIFQSETDGRSNFPHQKDCSDFGKQRDLFYAIREIWTSRQGQTGARGQDGGQGQQHSSYDPAYPKMKQLFQTNSSSTNLSRLASLFLSQSVLDLHAPHGGDRYDPYDPSFQNVRRILESNPSKYEKLRERLLVSDCVFDGNHPTPDPIAFLKYFITTSGSSEFVQHLIDHVIHEIDKMEREAELGDCVAPEAVKLIRKLHLLAEILGFLYYLPYRDDEYKKPIGSINVEVYLQSQIRLRKHQSFPLDLTAILVKSCTQNRLVFTLPWIIEFLTRADQVTFHLPAYKPILSFISCIYRELLPSTSTGAGASVNDEPLPQVEAPVVLSPDNKTLLRFMCGKLFGLPNFPDSYLFGNEMKSMGDFVIQNTPPRLVPVNLDEESVPLDLEDSIGSSFLLVWFRQEMKQIITILSTNATVRGSIPSATPGIVKHIRPVPQKSQSMEISVKNRSGANLQADLETHFFQIHPSSVKKTIDFISDQLSANFLKALRNKILAEMKMDFAQNRIFQDAGVVKCKEEVWTKLEMVSAPHCKKAVTLLLGDNVSPPVGILCQKICVRKTNEKVMDWVNQHVTRDLFPEVPVLLGWTPPLESQPNAPNGISEPETWTPAAGSFFLVLRSLHKGIQQLHNGIPTEVALIDSLLEDPRLISEKPWVTLRTVDLAMALITFSPSTLTAERQAKFIEFWKQVWTGEFNNFLRPRNLILLRSKSSDLKLTFQTLGSLMKALLRAKLVRVAEIQENCMALLQQDWDTTTKLHVSELLKEVMPDLDGTEEREVIDWIAWYCSGQGEEDSRI